VQPPRKLISICIPTYNRVNYLEETLRSILPQIGADIELLISDNCSTDGTKAMVARYQQTFRTLQYFRNERNLGFDGNVLRCLELASGEYVWFFGSDDVLRERAIKTVRERILGSCPRPTLVFLNYGIIENNGRLLVHRKILNQRDKEFTSARECLERLGLNLGFLSALVLRRERCLAVASTPEFVGSEWIHLHLVLCCLLAGGTTQYIGQPLVLARRSLTFDNDLTQVFVEKVDHILRDAYRRGYPWFVIYRVMNRTVREQYARFMLAWRSGARGDLEPLFPVLLRTCWMYPWFWLLIVPFRFMPRSLALALRGRLRLLRARRNDRLSRRLEQDPERQANWPSTSVEQQSRVAQSRSAI
jgi:abequosyltransferase